MAATLSPRFQDWLLEGYLDASERVVRVPIHAVPFRIGRASGQELRLQVDEVSSQHAVLRWEGGQLLLRDLGSTNGTFVNRRRIQEEVALADGDVLHFASAEFRLVFLPFAGVDQPTITRSFDQALLPHRYYPNSAAFRQMLDQRLLQVVYQPIVSLLEPGRPVVAWEALGRSTQPGVPEHPSELFKMAVTMGAAAELSRALREVAVAQATRLEGHAVLFVNTHPDEMATNDLLSSLDRLRVQAPGVQLVLEVHEAAVTDLPHMRALALALEERGVALAYDDFGAGQARLLELVEAPPAWLKFDRSMVAGLPLASPQRRQLVQRLVHMVREFGIRALAEGVETAEEATLCVELGFSHGQGWFFGRPA